MKTELQLENKKDRVTLQKPTHWYMNERGGIYKLKGDGN